MEAVVGLGIAISLLLGTPQERPMVILPAGTPYSFGPTNVGQAPSLPSSQAQYVVTTYDSATGGVTHYYFSNVAPVIMVLPGASTGGAVPSASAAPSRPGPEGQGQGAAPNGVASIDVGSKADAGDGAARVGDRLGAGVHSERQP